MLGSLILVIDDDPKIRQALEFSFPEYKFIGALSGEGGLELLQRPNDVDLVILDVKMERMGGIETLKKIKENSPRLGVMLLTAYGTKETVVQGLENHADDFVDKPFNVDQLRAKLKKYFDSRPCIGKENTLYTPSVQKIVRLLEKNYEKFLTLQDASDATLLSPKYLSRLFKKETRRSFVEFRTHLKIRHAKKMLKDPSFAIHDVADGIGYQNVTSFVKMFKKSTGRTPTEFRQKNTRS